MVEPHIHPYGVKLLQWWSHTFILTVYFVIIILISDSRLDTQMSDNPLPWRSKLKKGTKEFLSYSWNRYRSCRNSIFLDGLVGGMFLSFLIDTDDKCQDRSFKHTFVTISLFHFLSTIVNNLARYSRQASQMHGKGTLMERRIALVCVLIQHLVKVTEFPLVVWLGYYVIQFQFGDWTFRMDRVVPEDAKPSNCRVCYCDRNFVHLATLVFIFQIIFGIFTFILWFVMWWLHSEDDAKEEEEMREWKESEKRMRNTIYGEVKEITLIIEKLPFFNESLAAVMLILAVSLPSTSCNIHITNWFLYAGVVSTLTVLFDELLKDAKDMAAINEIVNRMEHHVIEFLKFCKLPLFVIEFIVYCVISEKTIEYSGDIILNKKEAQDKGKIEYYCERGPWNMMKLVSILYCVVLVFRVIVVFAEVMRVLGGENVGDKDVPEDE